MPNLLFPTIGGGGGAGTTYEFESTRVSSSAAAYVTVVDVSEPGVLYQLTIRSNPLAGGVDHLRITIDGFVETYTLGSNAHWYLRLHDTSASAACFYLAATPGNYEPKPVFWKTEFKVEIRSDAVNSVACKLQFSHG